MFFLRAKTAFTLIELLIVVAIIAILAAIAVPNFLEAQTRSKVARVKSDMRTVATGLESYQVDFNKYPPDFQYANTSAGTGSCPCQGPVDLNVRDIRSFLMRLVVLTTPVSYLTTIPEDVFVPAAIQRAAAANLVSPYQVPFASGMANLRHPFTFDYACRITPCGDDEDSCLAGLWTVRIAASNAKGVIWALRSIGPDLNATQLGDATLKSTSYDPTNGTVSDGDIFFLGPGIGPESGKGK
jgi:prepilin-type N-terminal cleavage/methylation domain-containing protein